MDRVILATSVAENQADSLPAVMAGEFWESLINSRDRHARESGLTSTISQSVTGIQFILKNLDSR
jgi:hypothetical protein